MLFYFLTAAVTVKKACFVFLLFYVLIIFRYLRIVNSLFHLVFRFVFRFNKGTTLSHISQNQYFDSSQYEAIHSSCKFQKTKNTYTV